MTNIIRLNDIQELYLTGIIHKNEAYDNIMETASHCHLDPLAVYELLVSSSKRGALDAESEKKMDKLKERLDLAVESESIFEELNKKIKNGTPSELKDYFLAHLPQLATFLEKVHMEMVQAPKVSEKYRAVKSAFRHFFLCLAKDFKEGEVNQYKHFSSHRLGRGTACVNSVDFTTLFLGELDYEKEMEVESFIRHLIRFRKDYLSRYCLDKVKNVIEKQMGKMRSGNFVYSEECQKDKKLLEKAKGGVIVDPDQLSLLALTFIHGSNATIFPNLLQTSMQLMPSGRLFKTGIVPLSGELGEGIVHNGINQYCLSGTSLDDGLRAIAYATKTTFHGNQELEHKIIVSFLNEPIASPYFTSRNIGNHWSRLTVAIKRLRILNAEAYRSIEAPLKALINWIEQELQNYKATDDYKKHMPRSLDPDGSLGYGYHDFYFADLVIAQEKALDVLKEALTAPLKPAPVAALQLMKNPYPVIFGSTSLYTKYLDDSEQCAQKASLIGKDIQIIFTSQRDRETTSHFLANQGIANVAVKTIEGLENAVTLNALASPYFADFASYRKLKKFHKVAVHKTPPYSIVSWISDLIFSRKLS